MGFTTIDYVIVLLYLFGVAIFGILSAGKQSSTKDYFLGNKSVPWWAVCFAIVATETSTITFIGVPGIAYLTNLNFLQIALGYILGRIVISFILLPSYFKGELVTAYALLTKRFGDKTRNITSIVFLITRTLATGVRLFATAIPLAIILKGYQIFSGNSDVAVYAIAILVITIFTFIYTYTGGIKAVIWTDVAQMVLYLVGAGFALVVLLGKIPGGFDTVMQKAWADNKFAFINWGFDDGFIGFFKFKYSFIAALIGGGFLSMASHGADQLIVQRVLATDSLKSGQKALIGSGFLVFIQFFFFMFIGIALYAYYGPGKFMRGDEVFPAFIVTELPTGVSGLIIASLFASAMGALSGSINSLASSTLIDLYKPYFGKNNTDKDDLRLSKIFSVIWTIALVGTAFLFMNITSVLEVALSIASLTYGGLLGTFLLGIMYVKPKQKDALIGLFAGLLIMAFVFFIPAISWTWYTFIGAATTIIVGNLSAKFLKK
jgi:solute:Na+ symporter, SSS family